MTDFLKPYVDKLQTSEGREYLFNLMIGNQWKNKLNEVTTYDYDLNKYAQSKEYKDIYEYAGNKTGDLLIAYLSAKGLDKLYASTTGGGINTGNNPTPPFAGTGGVKELGIWEKTNEVMSNASRNYQKYITGADDGMVYKVNGVKFDGFKDGVLIEAKGDYSNFVNKGTGEFQSWFAGQDSLISQANRQLNVAGGAKIQWYFNDQVSMNAVKELFLKENIIGIDFILKPMK